MDRSVTAVDATAREGALRRQGPGAPGGGWAPARGAAPLAGGKARFSVWAPRARNVEVLLPADGAAPGESGARAERLAARAGGAFERTLEDVAPGSDYLLRLDGGPPRPDPASRWQPEGISGPSRVLDPGAFAWRDDGWAGVPMEELVLYEIHVGTFSRAGTFAGVAPHLTRLAELGVTAIELMPVAEFPGRRNWGYDTVLPHAPHHAYGGPEGLRSLVDAAHGAGLGVVLDVVYNHPGPEGSHLHEFGPYFTDRYRTPWGPAWNFDGPGSDEARRFVVDDALGWIVDYHVDGLRLDAVHAMHDASARHILAELADEVHAAAAARGRRALLIAESDLNDPRLLRAPARGGLGLDGQWSDDFHHAVHAALTDERAGYYVDFGGLEPVAKALRDRFVLDGCPSAWRGRRHGAPAGDVPRDRFVIYVQNHDQVGNRARGERLTALVEPGEARLAAALLLLAPYPPLLFMGEEHGETAPFLYFVDHRDPRLRDAVREGRLREFASFGWEGEVPDPGDPATFEASRPDWGRAGAPAGRARTRLYRDLLALRRREPALRTGRGTLKVRYDPRAGWVATALSAAGGSDLAAVFAFGAAASKGGAGGGVDEAGGRPAGRKPTREPARATLPLPAGRWRRIFSTADEGYGGPGATGPEAVTVEPGAAASLPAPRPGASLWRREAA